jgi:hypothetical protein
MCEQRGLPLHHHQHGRRDNLRRLPLRGRRIQDAGPTRGLPAPTRPYQTLPGPYQTLPGPTTAYKSLPAPTRPYQTLPDPTRAYHGLPEAYQRPTRGLPEPTSPYQTLPDPTRPYHSLPGPNILSVKTWNVFVIVGQQVLTKG